MSIAGVAKRLAGSRAGRLGVVPRVASNSWPASPWQELGALEIPLAGEVQGPISGIPEGRRQCPARIRPGFGRITGHSGLRTRVPPRRHRDVLRPPPASRAGGPSAAVRFLRIPVRGRALTRRVQRHRLHLARRSAGLARRVVAACGTVKAVATSPYGIARRNLHRSCSRNTEAAVPNRTGEAFPHRRARCPHRRTTASHPSRRAFRPRPSHRGRGPAMGG